MDKGHILREIKRTADANGGHALGREKFRTETGIKESDWARRYWVKWGDALAEAGYAPNLMQLAYPEEGLLERFALFTRELGHYPTNNELRLQARRDPGFPSHTTWGRLGAKRTALAKLVSYCNGRVGFEDVLSIYTEAGAKATDTPKDVPPENGAIEIGWVYLLKSGRYYKIGRSNAAGRRERELAIQLPEKAMVMHAISTDDPVGIESYWHRRFGSKRKNGEWFDLSAGDVAAFRRRKFM